MVETRELRRRTMQAVKSKNTKPEMRVRKALHTLGYRYSLHKSGFPGKPDLVFPSRKKAVFINGCFWHGHSCKSGARTPKSNVAYWSNKIARNVERDAVHLRCLKKLGWKVMIVWECETKDINKATKRLTRFLG